MLSIVGNLQIPLSEVEFTYARSGGPGGQNVNKVNSKAVMRWRVADSSLPRAVKDRFIERFSGRLTTDGDLVLTSQKHRDQLSNVEECLEKVREMIAEVAQPPKRRYATKPGIGAIKRRIEGKREVSEKKERRRSPDMQD